MKINYILSDTTKNATTMALSNVIKKAESNLFQDFVVIVPETKSIIIEKELLDLSSSHSFANVFVYSFVRLINRLGFVSAENIVSKQVCVLLLRKIIYDNFDKLKCYKKTAKTVGFAEKIYETIAQFKSSNVSVEDLKLSLETKSESLKAKLDDIILLYEEYEKALGEDLYDDLDKLNLISKFAKNSDFIKNAEIFVVGFDNITYEMVSVLKELSANSKEITFSCVYFNEKREDKHIQSNELFLKFKRVADELKYPYVPVFYKTKKAGDFYAVQNYLFATTPKVVKSSGNISVFEATNKRQEIDALACKILDQIKQGKRFKDIGVFVCDLENDKELIKEYFESYNIPYFINDSYDVSNHFFVKFLMSALDLIASNCSADSVLSFLSNPIYGNEEFSSIYKYLQETGVSYENIFEFCEVKDMSDESKAKVQNVILKLKKFYFELKSKIKECFSFSDYLDVVEFIVDYFDVQSKLEAIAQFESENSLFIEAEICEQMLKKYQKFNDSARNFMGKLEVRFEEFVQIYFSGFSTIKINVAPVSIDSVIVQNNTDGFYNIDSMFIVGAEEGKFPAKINDSGIILDREIEETISHINKPVEPTIKEINKRETYRAYEALLEPKGRLFVSYSLNGLSGKSNRPARVVSRLIKLFGDNILEKTYYKPAFVNFETYAKAFARDVNKYLNDEIEHEKINKEFNQLKGNFGRRFEKFLNEIDYLKHDFILKNVDGLYFYGDKTSISQLEKYFDCPYLFFATYGLRLKENKNAKISSLDVGTIIHRVVELFVQQIEEFKGLDEIKFDFKVEELLKQSITESGIFAERNKAVIKLLFGECKKLCRHIFVEQENSGFKHKKSEWCFEGENAINLNLLNGKVIRIEGKIDRIDEFSNYIRIIDYKTGKVDSDFNSIYYGTKIQLISYLSATVKYGEKKVAGVFYFPIHSDYATSEKMLKNMYRMEGFLLNDISVVKNMDYSLSLEENESSFVPLKVKADSDTNSNQMFEFYGTSNKRLSESEFETIKTYTNGLCENAVNEIVSGYIEPAPFATSASSGTARCKYCKLAGFCGLEKSRFKFGRVCSDKASISSFKDVEKEAKDE